MGGISCFFRREINGGVPRRRSKRVTRRVERKNAGSKSKMLQKKTPERREEDREKKIKIEAVTMYSWNGQNQSKVAMFEPRIAGTQAARLY
jgi:hypothetical protein